MNTSESISLLDFSLALSETLDVASPLLSQHQLRTAYIALRISMAMHLPPSVVEGIVIASLLHDVGAMSPEEKIALHEDDYDLNIHLHCKIGKKILGQSSVFEKTAEVVRYHHKEWHEWELSEATEIALLSQVVFLADVVERAIDRSKYILHQNENIIAQITCQSGTAFLPDAVEAFLSVAGQEEFWLDCVSSSLQIILREMVLSKRRIINRDEILEVSEVVRKLIDFRSHFTATHSAGVSSASALIALQMGYSDNEVKMMRFAGNMHDVGKLSVPNSILEKPSRLTSEEYAVIRQHTYHTCVFMHKCGFPQWLVEWAGYHHERINGEGYPYHKKDSEINEGSRIVAVADALIAMAEDRPYRKAMCRNETISVLKDMVREEHLDADVVHTVEHYYDDIVEPTLLKQKVAKEQFAEDMKILA